jgi:hypothetical protein
MWKSYPQKLWKSVIGCPDVPGYNDLLWKSYPQKLWKNMSGCPAVIGHCDLLWITYPQELWKSQITAPALWKTGWTEHQSSGISLYLSTTFCQLSTAAVDNYSSGNGKTEALSTYYPHRLLQWPLSGGDASQAPL